jgi:hypothetical protein
VPGWPRTDLRPAVVAGVALTAFRAALRRWVDSDGSESLDEAVDQALAPVGPVIELGVDAG